MLAKSIRKALYTLYDDEEEVAIGTTCEEAVRRQAGQAFLVYSAGISLESVRIKSIL